jgi:hypothetical protein
MRRPITLLAITFLVLAGLQAAPALAVDACSSTLENRYDGFGYNPSAAYGTSAYIVVQSSTPCSGGGPGNFTNAWAMISAGQYSYSQAGFFRYETGLTYSCFGVMRRG